MKRDILELQKENNENFLACTEVDGCLYYSDRNKNGLYKINMFNHECSFVTLFDEDLSIMGLHEFALLVERSIWFFPYRQENRIAIYCVDTGDMEYIEYPESKWNSEGRMFSGGVVYQNYIWLIPNCYDAFLRIDPVNREISRIEMNIALKQEWEDWKFISGTFHKGNIYVCPWNHNRIVCLACNTCIVKELKYEIPREKYRNIVGHNERFYLIPRDVADPLLIVQEEDCESIEFDGITGTYIGTFVGKENILWMVPLQGDRIIQFSLENKKWKVIWIQADEQYSFGEARKCSERLTVLLGNAHTPMLVYDCQMNEIWSLKVNVSEEAVFQKIMCAISGKKQETSKSMKEVGKSIYKYCCEGISE